MKKLKILKTGNYCIHPAHGPIVSLKKGVVCIDGLEDKGFSDENIKGMIDNGWAEHETSKRRDVDQIIMKGVPDNPSKKMLTQISTKTDRKDQDAKPE
jgi:hypothetical protein